MRAYDARMLQLAKDHDFHAKRIKQVIILKLRDVKHLHDQQRIAMR